MLQFIPTEHMLFTHLLFSPQLTYADFATYLLFQYVCENIEGAKDKYPKLAKIHAIVETLPKIAKWLKSRPETLA